MIERGYIEFKTHGVIVYRNTESSTICCMKTVYGKSSAWCDLEVFDNQDDAIEWILKPFPTERAMVILEEE